MKKNFFIVFFLSNYLVIRRKINEKNEVVMLSFKCVIVSDNK